MKHLIFLITVAWTVACNASSDFPAAFKTDKFRLSTLKQFEERIKVEHPKMMHKKTLGGQEIYKNISYKTMVLNSDGIEADKKFAQKLTYIKLHKGLWKLLYIEGNECTKGEITENGVVKTQWGCDELVFPISKAFVDLFIIEDLNVDLKQLSADWGKEVVVNDGKEVEEVELIQTLGDLKKFILDNDGSWVVEKSVWKGTEFNPQPEKPALVIKVNGPLDSKSTYEQSFLYVVDGDLLNLKEIDGKKCTFNEVHNKIFCEEVYSPTLKTPFPIQLMNTEDLSPPVDNKKDLDIVEKKPELYCGNIYANYNSALRVYFETSIFSINDIKGYRKALSILPEIVDPQNLFLSQKLVHSMNVVNESPYPLSEVVSKLMNEIGKGTSGNCDALLPIAQDIRNQIFDKGVELKKFISLLGEIKFNESEMDLLVKNKSSFIQKVWDVIKKSKLAQFNKSQPSAALDIASGFMLRYYETALSRASDPEELYTAALFKKDSYSRLLHESEVMTTAQTVHGHSDRKYFGIRISSGSQYHYIFDLHPETKKSFNLMEGDKILKINGVDASVPNISAKEVDDILINTDKSIDFIVERKGEPVSVPVQAREIDLMEYFYNLNIQTSSSGKKVLKVKIDSFEAGLTESLYLAINKTLSSEDFDAIILDLQSNPGGSTDEAAAVISFFTNEKNPYFYRKGSRFLDTATAYPGKPELFITDTLPLVVQTNSYTASAAEIVTSSLKDLNRAVVVGAQTFGKLIGQHYESVPLGNSKKVLAMLVTALEYFTPTGRSLNGKGIKAHIDVYSQHGGVFKDGNSPGIDYLVPEDLTTELYPELISPEEIVALQEAVILDSSNIDQVSLKVIDVMTQH